VSDAAIAPARFRPASCAVTDCLVPRQPTVGGIAGRIADRLLDLANDVGRLSPPDHRDPERFHIEKSELADELRRVAHDAQQRLSD
jgi:hypothetical protein